MELRLNPEAFRSLQIQLPGSKSLSNRFLIIRALSNSDCQLHNLSASRDTTLLQRALEHPGTVADFADGATPARLYLAYAAALNIPTTVSGNESLRKRSVAPLAGALGQLGAITEYQAETGFLPVSVKQGITTFETATVDHSQSSQYTSALMLIAAALPGKRSIRLEGNKQAGFSYTKITAWCMKQAGISVIQTESEITIAQGSYQLPESLTIESDWSSAAWWYMFCACIPGSSFHLPGLMPDSPQGDRKLTVFYETFGVESTFTPTGLSISNLSKSATGSIHFHLQEHIDLAPAIICTCAFLNLRATFSGLENLQFKESDRIQAIQQNLLQLGHELTHHNGTWTLHQNSNSATTEPVTIRTHSDHRIAMAFAVFALRFKMIPDDADCVVKSYPGFWDLIRPANFI